MTSSEANETDPAPIAACTVARDVQNFDLLIEDMETELGEAWGDLNFADAASYLSQPDARELKFIAIAVNGEDEDNLAGVGNIISQAKKLGVQVILIAEDVSPIALHQLLKFGADDFVPYPLPDGALHEAITRLDRPKPVMAQESTGQGGAVGNHDGVILPVHGLAGGTGSSTFVVNLAWELANLEKKSTVKVCILDFDFQFGSIATYLDLPRREAVYEMLSDVETLDDEAFRATLLSFNDKIDVLTAPSEMLPLDIMSAEDIEKIVKIAQRNFDYVLIDMPSTLVQWTETILGMSHVYFGTMEMDLRSAQNALRMVRALKSEDLPYEKIRYVLNRAPKFTDLSGKSRVKRMAESLDIDIELLMPDGGVAVSQSCDHGIPLAEGAAKNPLRKEIVKLAKSLHEVNQSAIAAE
ncbi:AAA family ATPase [Litoreibacter roseus]|uniref:Pilus assembly protein CpaE n=1 Tax=Litoreibacter roseus TaxID=2601869 RepID=A0A6N6JGP8_9RHOB|nr:AAA family ATPase [Litoreibacter roseus]GFE65406.1 pilus assembly protein CpaE [Litoreibacter roseus]